MTSTRITKRILLRKGRMKKTVRASNGPTIMCMRLLGYCLLAVLPALAAEQDQRVSGILSRLSEEAEVFRQAAPQTFSQETLRQKARKAPPRFLPRTGDAALKPPPVRYPTREIVSEYSYSFLRESPNVLHEFRQVTSVDGKQVAAPEKARRTLALGMQSSDDIARKQMLMSFEKYGLSGAATDFGQLILLFSKRHIANYRFSIVREDRLGADEALVLEYRQKAGPDAVTIFQERRAIRSPLEGEVWVRKPDYLPLRITMVSRWTQAKSTIQDEAAVDYNPSSLGLIVPISVVHRETAADGLIAENIFHYAPFHKFSAQAEIKFTEGPEEPAPPKKP